VPFLPLLTQPTLIVSGDDDPIIPLANARIMRRLIPDSTLHVFRGGHLGLVTEAAELAPVISQFLLADSGQAGQAGRAKQARLARARRET
jgi:pimeloyl-ACP methyl ester carboxylesterase